MVERNPGIIKSSDPYTFIEKNKPEVKVPLDLREYFTGDMTLEFFEQLFAIEEVRRNMQVLLLAEDDRLDFSLQSFEITSAFDHGNTRYSMAYICEGDWHGVLTLNKGRYGIPISNNWDETITIEYKNPIGLINNPQIASFTFTHVDRTQGDYPEQQSNSVGAAQEILTWYDEIASINDV